MEEFIVGDLQDLVAAHLIFIVVAAFNTKGYCLVLIFLLSISSACIVDSALVSMHGTTEYLCGLVFTYECSIIGGVRVVSDNLFYYEVDSIKTKATWRDDLRE